jgi:nucleotide-binding universal stress UspA family protein
MTGTEQAPGPVVVGVEESDRSQDGLKLARVLARVLDAELILVNAYPWEPGEESRPEYEALVHRQSEELLEAIRIGMPSDAASTRCVPTFSAARALHDVAVAEGASAIVLGATSHAVHGCVALGSVAERLLSGAPCPVVVAPRGYERHSAVGSFERIGAAYVPGDEGRSAVRAAALIAARCTAPVRLIEVADPRIWAADAWTGRADAGELAEAQLEVVGRHLMEAHRSLPVDVTGTTTVLAGDPADELRKQSLELDLLVCGSRAYGPSSGVLAGGVSKVLMHGAGCPVMVVPRGTGRALPQAA